MNPTLPKIKATGTISTVTTVKRKAEKVCLELDERTALALCGHFARVDAAEFRKGANDSSLDAKEGYDFTPLTEREAEDTVALLCGVLSIALR